MQAHYFTVSGPAYTGQALRSGGTDPTLLSSGGTDPAPRLGPQRTYGHQTGGFPTKPDFFAAGFGGGGVFTKAGVAASFGAASPLLEALFLPLPLPGRRVSSSLLGGRSDAPRAESARSGSMRLPGQHLPASEVLPRRARWAGWGPDGGRPIPESEEERRTRLDAQDEARPSSTPLGGTGMAADTRLKQQLQQRHGGRCLVPEHTSTTAELGSREEAVAEEEEEDSVSEGPAWGDLWRISEDGSSGEEGDEGESGG